MSLDATKTSICLRSLDLTGNHFADWSSLSAVNSFSSVTSLCLEENPINDEIIEGSSLIDHPLNDDPHIDNLIHDDSHNDDSIEGNSTHNPPIDHPLNDPPIDNSLNDSMKANPIKANSLTFPHVTSLNVAATSLRSLATLRAILTRFPALTDLELRRNPWYAATEHARGTVIALCPKLTQLNGATVTAEERREEEVAFVRREIQRLLEKRKLTLEQLVKQKQPLAGQPELEVGEKSG